MDHRDFVEAPAVLVLGRFHALITHYLRHNCQARPNPLTANRVAHDLAAWLRFLCNERGYVAAEGIRDPVLLATRDDFAAYYRKRQYGRPDEMWPPASWRRSTSAIKRFYEYLLRQYQLSPPFDIVNFRTRDGFSGTKVDGFAPRRAATGSAGQPLTPKFAQLLLMAAWRVHRDGRQDLYRGADRDLALLSLALASGLRRNNLVCITHHEIPPISSLPLTTMRVASGITKGHAGGDTLVFSHYLPAIYAYIDGARADVNARTTYRPPDPLHVTEANPVSVTFRPAPAKNPPEVPASGQNTQTMRWTDMGPELRRQLVEPDGSSPVLFLNEYTGSPLAWDSLSNIIETARNFAHTHLEPDFPVTLRLHDLRHTYAVHLTIAIYRDVIAESLPPSRRPDWTVDHLAAAIELVKSSLGHASPASTSLYLSAAHRFLNIPLDEFLGRF